MPSFVPAAVVTSTTAAVPERRLKPTKSIKKSKSSHALVPTVSKPSPRARRVVETKLAALISPAAEYPKKLRWQTPRRTGKWSEPWQSARELGLHVCVRTANAADIMAVVKQCVAHAVVSHVGPHLPKHTVEKWLCLLCEYLDLNADEQVLVVCLLRKYVSAGGKFVGTGDWARPQRWECVVAVACYLAVLLTEEFPGRAAMDLRELLGPNFRFGKEQIDFLKTIDWKITVHPDMFKEVKDTSIDMIEGTKNHLDVTVEWFNTKQSTTAPTTTPSAPTPVATAPIKQAKSVAQPVISSQAGVGKNVLIGKKRSFASIAPAEESVVPGIVVPGMNAPHVHSVPTLRTIPTMQTLQTVPALAPAFMPTLQAWPTHW